MRALASARLVPFLWAATVGLPATVGAGPPTAVVLEAPLPIAPFVDVTAAAGIDFVHHTGAAGEKLLPETMGGGVAVLDYDRDGDPDLLFVDSAGDESGRGVVLYANDGDGRFRDVTAATGLAAAARTDPADPFGGFYGQGVAVGDLDADGWPDLYLTAVGPDRLLRNEGGRFRDVTAEADLGGAAGWSTGAAWLDADGDGDLDLAVASYLDWSPALDRRPEILAERTVAFADGKPGLIYGLPQSYRGAQPLLYLNRGDGTFVERAAAAGLHVVEADGQPVAKALAVAAVDLDRDGRLDLLLADDTTRNLFFRNLGPSDEGEPRFEELGELWGLAWGPDGNATGAMGVDWGELGASRDLAIAVGNFAGEAVSLYRAQGDPTFYLDDALRLGLGAITRAPLTFGVLLLDDDLDGRLDLLIANGHVEPDIARIDPERSYLQPPQLFRDVGDGEPRFAPVPPERAGDLARPLAGRGLASLDLEGDGDLDLVLTQVGGPANVLRREAHPGPGWLRVRLEQPGPNRDAVGARLELRAGGRLQVREIQPARSYLTALEPAATFGVPDGGRHGLRLVVRWPDGARQAVGLSVSGRDLVVRRPASLPPVTPASAPPSP